jgi:glycosyltransferase involved in cell wall biosynthesis
MKQIKSLSVFFLCYNDKNTIANLIETALSILKDIADDYEVVVVDDGSTDGSGQILESLAKKCPELRITHHEKNLGYGAAIKTGLKLCKKELIFYTDGDGQYDINEIQKLLEFIDGVDVVNGFLYKRRDPFYRIVLGRIYQLLLRLLFKIPISYIDCDFRLFKKYVIDNLNLESNGGFVCAEMIKKIIDRGYRIKEVAIHHYPRLNSKSQFFKWRNIYRLLFDCFKFYLKDTWNIDKNSSLKIFGSNKYAFT